MYSALSPILCPSGLELYLLYRVSQNIMSWNCIHTYYIIGYYTGSSSVRLDIFTSQTYYTKTSKNIQPYWPTNCNKLFFTGIQNNNNKINQGKNEFEVEKTNKLINKYRRDILNKTHHVMGLNFVWILYEEWCFATCKLPNVKIKHSNVFWSLWVISS